MTTAIIGVGRIGGALARRLVAAGERVVLAARDEPHAAALAQKLGALASAASVRTAIGDANVVVFAVRLDVMKELLAEHGDTLRGRVVVDPSNPVKLDDRGQVTRTLPPGHSAGSDIAALVTPIGAHYVKAFGTLGAADLESAANRTPQRAVLFYATDDQYAARTIEHLITAAGFAPLKVGGVTAAIRIEVPGGDLHQHGGLKGRLLAIDEARAAIDAVEPDTDAVTRQPFRAAARSNAIHRDVSA